MADEIRLKRLKIRAWRRGTKEMDLVLGPFCDDEAASLSEPELDLFEALLAENDHDLYGWVTGQAPVPDRFAPLIGRIARHAGAL
ncbi:succinate dehydrogenase assembly factor 2 [Palleronia sp. KMU-117]|uniref:FAD assembly factor SdhE n=1 Tax=Palleronia sp. KMU-117 TaxID=3434108 RepID=UPI003D73FF12